MGIVLISLVSLLAAETPPEGAQAGGIDPVVILFVVLLLAGLVLAALLFGMSAVTPAWNRFMSNTDRQMLMNGSMIGAMFLLLGVYAAFEPFRLSTASVRQQHEAIERGVNHYAQFCVVCHGVQGQGGPVPPGQVVGQSAFAPPLARADFRPESNEELAEKATLIRKTIERGRPNTSMPAWSIEEGGGLNSQEIDDLVAFIQHGEWAEVAAHVTAEQRATIAEAAAAAGQAAPGAADIPDSPGKTLFQAKGCAGCHIIQGFSAGTVGPALDNFGNKTDQIAGVLPMNQANLVRWLKNPPAEKPGTAMPNLNLTDEEAQQLADFLLSLK